MNDYPHQGRVRASQKRQMYQARRQVRQRIRKQTRKIMQGLSLSMGMVLITAVPAIAQETNGGFAPQDWLINGLQWVQGLLASALQWVQGLGAVGALVFIGLYILATVAFLPGSILTLGAGVVFGVVQGSLLVFVGATLGATAAFLVGRYLARGRVAREIEGNARFKAIDRAVGKEGLKIVLLTRLSPVFPFNLLNYALGLTSVSLKDYVLGCVGMIPGTVMYVYLGSLAGNLATLAAGESPENAAIQWTIRIIGFIATVAVTVYVTRIAQRALAESVDDDDAPDPHSLTPQADARSSQSSYPQTAGTKRATSQNPTMTDTTHLPTTHSPTTVSPLDEYNQTLVNHVHPPDWNNPHPAEIYDLVVIGAGTAGLVVAKGAAGLDVGLKVALIERHLMGGDCLNVGCVPSKTLIRSSRVVAEMRGGDRYGIQPPESVQVDFPAVMQRVRQVRATISPIDSAASAQKAGVDVFLGNGTFTGSQTISVAGQTLRFKKAVIATGARAVRPSIEGIDEVGCLTNETVFNLTERPQRLAVVGGGPIGCELAQAFQRLGSEVIIFHRGNHLLNKEDADAAEIVQEQFLREGIQLALNSEPTRFEATPDGKRIHYTQDGKPQTVTVDEILIGAGRAPNVESLNLEAVGVDYDPRKGVRVNDYLQTSNPNIYAAGDICMDWKFTHAADAAARIVIKNTLFSPFGLGRYKLSDLVMPWATYTDPEIAHVGLYEEEAQRQGIPTQTIKIPFHDLDRAIADGQEAGFVKILHRQGADEILGATIVAKHAGDLISEVTTAITNKIGLSKMASVIHPYPTQAEGVKKAADAYRRTLLTPRTKWFLGLLTKVS